VRGKREKKKLKSRSTSLIESVWVKVRPYPVRGPHFDNSGEKTNPRQFESEDEEEEGEGGFTERGQHLILKI